MLAGFPSSPGAVFQNPDMNLRSVDNFHNRRRNLYVVF